MLPELYNLVLSFFTYEQATKPFPIPTSTNQKKSFLSRPLLDAMATEWSLITFHLQRSRDTDGNSVPLGQGRDGELWACVKELTPTLVSVLKGNVTVLRLFERDADNKAVPLPWGDLGGVFGVRGTVKDGLKKVCKRLQALFQEVSHYLVMPDTDMFEAVLNFDTNGQAISVTANREARRAGQHYGTGTTRTSIATYSLPAKRFDTLHPVFDGKGNYIRPSTFAKMTNAALNRARAIDSDMAKLLVGFSVSVVDGKLVSNIPVTAGSTARRLFERRFACTIMNGRMPLPQLGTVKGDWIVAENDDALCADFVVYAPNITPELYTINEVTYFTANPVYEKTNRKTSRQTIAHLHSSVLPHGRLVKNMRNYVIRMVESFRNSQPLFIGSRALEDLHRDDPINDAQHKSALWSDAGLPTRLSPQLMFMLTNQFFDMEFKGRNKGKRDDDKFPLMNGQFRSAKSVTDLIFTGYVSADFVLAEGTWMDSPIGMIMADFTYADVLRVLGKGDGDDHVEILMFEVLYACVIDGLSFEAGELVSILVRYPLGYSSDGVEFGSEYYILKPDATVAARYINTNPNGLDTVDLAMLPKRADRISVVQTLFPQAMRMVDDVVDANDTIVSYDQNYSFENARRMFWACTFSMEAGGIGAMANMQMLAALHGVAVPLPCDTETMVDAVAGVAPSFKTSCAALAAVQGAYRHLEALNIPIDELALERVKDNFTPAVQADPNGFDTLLYAARDAELTRARAELDAVAADGLDELRRMFGGISWKPWQGGDAPLLVNFYRDSKSAYGTHLNHSEFRAVGDDVASKMEGLEAQLGSSIMARAIAQAYAHQLTTDRPLSAAVDQMFFQGALFEHTLALFTELFVGADGFKKDVVAINCTATTHADGCELLTSVTPSEAADFTTRGCLSEACSTAGMTSWKV